MEEIKNQIVEIAYMLEQLERNGIFFNININELKEIIEEPQEFDIKPSDLIDDYMSLWGIKNDLQNDIKERGITYEDFNSHGIKVTKDNPSVKNLININRQMLAIIEKLKLDPNSIIPTEDEDDNL